MLDHKYSKILLNPKNLNLKCKSSDFWAAQLYLIIYIPEKNKRKKIILWSVGGEVKRHAFFRKSRKKPKKRILSRLESSNFIFKKNKVCHASYNFKSPREQCFILFLFGGQWFFLYKMRPKWSYGDHDPFFDFDMFH
jgi:hypothetical protein